METLIGIMENPNVEKGYQDLKKHYLNNEMTEEAKVIDFLIEQKFNANNSNIDQKQ